jgi:hypothetical protein
MLFMNDSTASPAVRKQEEDGPRPFVHALVLLSVLVLPGACQQPGTAELAAPAAGPPARPNGAAARATAPTIVPESFGHSEAVENGALARYVRGEALIDLVDAPVRDPVPTEFLCVATGEFNVAPARDHLQMETWCCEAEPPAGSIALMQVEDARAQAIAGKPDLFRAPFEDTVVSVVGESGEPVVFVRYRDSEGQIHDMLLPSRAHDVDAKYAYSFADFVPEAIVPLGERRVIPR